MSTVSQLPTTLVSFAGVMLFGLCGFGPIAAAQCVYVADLVSNNVAVIDGVTNTVAAFIPVGTNPHGVAVPRDGSAVYVTNFLSNDVSVIDPSSNAVVATIAVGGGPVGIAASEQVAYVANKGAGTVSVIDAVTRAVTATIPVGGNPEGVAVSPDSGTGGRARRHRRRHEHGDLPAMPQSLSWPRGREPRFGESVPPSADALGRSLAPGESGR